MTHAVKRTLGYDDLLGMPNDVRPAYELVVEARDGDRLTHPDWPDVSVDLAELWR